jgi:acetyl esterase/lipase
MQIDADTIVTDRDVRRARKLNSLLNLLPRYRTSGRLPARLINALLRARRILPSSAALKREVRVDQQWMDTDRRKGIRYLLPVGQARGAYLHVHGGAWITMDARFDDAFNSMLVREHGFSVAALDFHSATDDRLQLSFVDVLEAMAAVFDRCREQQIERLVIGGESSGAHLALCALHKLMRERAHIPVSGFVSMCGAFDVRASPSLHRSTEHSLLVSGPSAFCNLKRLMPPEAQMLRELSPLDFEFNDMPPALLIAGTLDPIVDDSTELYRKWNAGSGNAQLLVVPEGPHGFHRLPTMLAAKTQAFAREWISAHAQAPE